MKCDVRWGACTAIGAPKVGNSRRWAAHNGANRFGHHETRQDTGGHRAHRTAAAGIAGCSR
jgi:hypothetical protein